MRVLTAVVVKPQSVSKKVHRERVTQPECVRTMG
jgi:hypothetical protein